MEMLQLKYFYESAQNESFAKTAKKNMVPTTSVSASVRRLEKELGAELFDRTGNSITLNSKGREFYASIKHIFSELDSAVKNVTNDTPDQKHEIRILTYSVRAMLTTQIISYQKNHPLTVFYVDADFDEKDFSKYDIIIMKESAQELSDYESFYFRKYNVRVEVPEDSPLCEKKLYLRQLENLPFVCTGVNNEHYKMFINACKREGFTPNFIFECNDYACVDRYLRRGLALDVALTAVGGSDLAQMGMKHLNIVDFDATLTLNIYCKKKKYVGAVKDFIDHLISGN